jgi:hypothetical protein
MTRRCFVTNSGDWLMMSLEHGLDLNQLEQWLVG